MTVENINTLNPWEHIVWTQAGFKKACQYIRNVHHEEDQEIKGWPNSYPSYVEFVEHYEGYFYWTAQCTPLKKAIERLQAKLNTVQKISLEHSEQLKYSTQRTHHRSGAPMPDVIYNDKD